MVMNIASALNAYHQTAGAGRIAGEAGVEGASFGDTLKGFFDDSVATIKQGEQAAEAGAVGKADMQSVIMAVDKASMTLEAIVALRDKVVGAYQEIIRMQV